MIASEVAAASGYLQCEVCALVCPLPVPRPFLGASKLSRFGKWAVAGVTLVGILVSISGLWPGDYSPWVTIKQALCAAPLAPEEATVSPESAVGGWRSARETGDASHFSIGEERGAIIAHQRISQQGGGQQLEGP